MRKWQNNTFIFIIICFINILNLKSQTIENRCATQDFEKLKREKDPNYDRKRIIFNNSIKDYISRNGLANGRRSMINELIKIPVVVHVIHNNSSGTIGGRVNANISDEQIKSQIDVLNEDYRRKSNTLGFNNNPIGADMNIEFFLAETDPDGNETNGITRNFTDKQSFDPLSNKDQILMSSINYWPSDCYLNIWTTTLSNNYLGFSQFPSAPNFDGLDPESDEKVDGLYIDYKFFGRNSTAITSKYYKYGRTTTHEIGHWLGLIHTWGDEDCGDDYVNDTPTIEGPNLTVVCVDKFSNCTGTRTRNMIENYLDYTIDSCMNTFTIGQLERVRAVFEVSPRRKKLIECITQLPQSIELDLTISPNPALDYVKGTLLLNGTSDVEVALFDLKGQEIDKRTFQNKKSFKFSIPIYNLAKGMYIILCKTNSQTVSKRFFVSGN